MIYDQLLRQKYLQKMNTLNTILGEIADPWLPCYNFFPQISWYFKNNYFNPLLLKLF